MAQSPGIVSIQLFHSEDFPVRGLTTAKTHLEAGHGSLSLLQMLGCCVFRNQMVAQGFKEEPVSEEEEKLKV